MGTDLALSFTKLVQFVLLTFSISSSLRHDVWLYSTSALKLMVEVFSRGESTVIKSYSYSTVKVICDMIKRNESDVRDVVFEILETTVFKSCFILFLALSNPS